MMVEFNLQEEVLALQDEASYHLPNDPIEGADPNEVRELLDGEYNHTTWGVEAMAEQYYAYNRRRWRSS